MRTGSTKGRSKIGRDLSPTPGVAADDRVRGLERALRMGLVLPARPLERHGGFSDHPRSVFSCPHPTRATRHGPRHMHFHALGPLGAQSADAGAGPSRALALVSAKGFDFSRSIVSSMETKVLAPRQLGSRVSEVLCGRSHRRPALQKQCGLPRPGKTAPRRQHAARWIGMINVVFGPATPGVGVAGPPLRAKRRIVRAPSLLAQFQRGLG